MKTALFLGRFQPFHNGHFNAIKRLSKNYDKVIIALCSAQCSGTKRNPFGYHDRYHMIMDSLWEARITNCQIIPIPDINCPEKWAQFCHAIYGDYDVVYTNNPNTRELFESIGSKVKEFDLTFVRGKLVCGTTIREKIAKNKSIKSLVPYPVRLYIYNNLLDEILKDIYEKKVI